MNITIHYTSQLSNEDWSQITIGFNRSFDEAKREDELKSYYHRNLKGESYHAICRNDLGQIVAHTSIVPQLYVVEGEEKWLGLSGGSFVIREYRHEAFLMVDMIDYLRKFIQDEGVVATFGVPNENFLGLLKDIYEINVVKYLKYHVLPINFFKLLWKNGLKMGEMLSSFFAYLWLIVNYIPVILHNSKSKEQKIHLKTSKAYYASRFNENYQKFQQSKFTGVYRTYIEKGIKVAYIFDFREENIRTSKALLKLLWHLLRHERLDIVLYIGDIEFSHKIMFKLPIRFEPKRLALTFKLLDTKNSQLHSTFIQPDHWDFGLMDFDVR